MSGFKNISVGKDGTVWGATKTDGALFYRKDDSGQAWIPNKGGKAEVVAAVSETEIWCVNKAHQIWHFDSNKWSQVATQTGKPDARTISVGTSDGSVWYSDSQAGKLFRREGSSWIQDKDGKAMVVAAVSKDEIWCINREHQIWHLFNDKWTQVATRSGKGDAITISAGSDGSVWYGDTSGILSIFHIDGSVWEQVPHAQATVVAVGSQTNVWCVNSDGDAFHRTPEGGWQKVDQPKGVWEYLVKQGDGLYAIVRQQYQLTDEKEVQRIGDLVATENHLQNKDRLDAGAVLQLQSY